MLVSYRVEEQAVFAPVAEFLETVNFTIPDYFASLFIINVVEIFERPSSWKCYKTMGFPLILQTSDHLRRHIIPILFLEHGLILIENLPLHCVFLVYLGISNQIPIKM